MSAVAGDRRTAILDAALEAFTADGYEATTIADVRRRSGASVGSIYHHFADKRGLAASLYIECLAAYQRDLGATLDANPGAERGVRATVAHHLDWVGEHPARAAFLFERREPEVAAASTAEVRALNRDAFARWRRWLDPHVKAGRIRRMSLELFYAIVLGPSQEFARGWVQEPDPRRMAAAKRELARAAWDGVRADRREIP